MKAMQKGNNKVKVQTDMRDRESVRETQRMKEILGGD